MSLIVFAMIFCSVLVEAAPVNDTLPFETDILGIDASVMGDRSQLATKLSGAVNGELSGWPGGIIPFAFDNEFAYSQQSQIRKAMSDFHRFTCVKFIPHTTESDYILIRPGPSSSYVGKAGGRQSLFLNIPRHTDLTTETGAIQHELMHAIGFYHEQTRTDRDNYVEINWENIETWQQNNFHSYVGQTFDLPYDFKSVMHYKSNEFAINDEDWTIRPREQYGKQDIGQRKRMSQLDIARINKLYKCLNRDDAVLNTSTTRVTLTTNTELTTFVPSLSVHGIGFQWSPSGAGWSRVFLEATSFHPLLFEQRNSSRGRIL